jgi:uncharacterized NAD(P)/FAD-binding protein YdhS
VHRHRIAPEIGAIVQDFLDSGQLTVTAARIQDYQATAEGANVTIKLRKSQTQQVLTVNRIVNCTGIQIDYLFLFSLLTNILVLCTIYLLI